MQPEELPRVIDEAEEIFDEVYGQRWGAKFDKKFFLNYWDRMFHVGLADVFLAHNEEGVDMACFGGVHTNNIFTGEHEYVGIFTVVGKAHRGTGVIYQLYDYVFAELSKFTGFTTFTTRHPALQHILKKYGFVSDGETFRRVLS